jgi:hypothetical protein
MWFIKRTCPHVWSLLNQGARLQPTKGMEDYVSGIDGAVGRRQLELADSRIANLIAKTSQPIVGDAYRRDLSRIGTTDKLAELLCEIALVDALGSISDAKPILRPKTETKKHCDVKIVVDGDDLYGEVKRLADRWERGLRSMVKSGSDAKPDAARRPRSMDIYDKLKAVYTQFPQGTLNVLFLLHPGVWNSQVYIQQALFGDASGIGRGSDELPVNDDGLFARSGWEEISACAYSQVNPDDGSVSVVHIWRNPKANVPLADHVRERLGAVR